MLTQFRKRVTRDCSGTKRRDFIRVGSLGFGGLTLSNFFRMKAHAQEEQFEIKDKSVIWIWFAGGPTHVETFDPKLTAPSEYRSTTGEANTPMPGVTIGGTFPQIASVADKMAFVRSYQIGSNGHSQGTVINMTGQAEFTGKYPSMGSIIARAGGISNDQTGMPSYMNFGNIGGQGPGYLGPRYSPFPPNGEAARSMALKHELAHLNGRFGLRDELDCAKWAVANAPAFDGIDAYTEQAFGLIAKNAESAFKIDDEKPELRERYGKTAFGDTLLKARRLVERGTRFVTVTDGGWDMHGKVKDSITRRSSHIDPGISGLIFDLDQRGLLDDTLVVVTGEFGRTPRVNKNAGRDHWGRLCTLALAGGGLNMGQVIGESSRKIEAPATTPITPQDLMATIIYMFGLDPIKLKFYDTQGRPNHVVPKGKPIAELIG